MLKNFKAEYQEVKLPIKNCSFYASGGAEVSIEYDELETNSVTFMVGGIDGERMSYTKEDFIALMDVLRNIESQL